MFVMPNNTKIKNTVVHNFLFQIHFAFLYVLLFSTFRNNWWFMDEPTELETVVSKILIIGFFVWFIGVNILLFVWKQKGTWNRSDYFSWPVIVSSLLAILLLEVFVFT